MEIVFSLLHSQGGNALMTIFLVMFWRDYHLNMKRHQANMDCARQERIEVSNNLTKAQNEFRESIESISAKLYDIVVDPFTGQSRYQTIVDCNTKMWLLNNDIVKFREELIKNDNRLDIIEKKMQHVEDTYTKMI